MGVTCCWGISELGDQQVDTFQPRQSPTCNYPSCGFAQVKHVNQGPLSGPGRWILLPLSRARQAVPFPVLMKTEASWWLAVAL